MLINHMYSILVVLFVWVQAIDLQKTRVNEFITISLPASFERLSTSEINQKFLSTNQPIAVYGDPSRTIDLSINTSFSRWREDDIALMMSFYKSTIMGLYDEVQFNKEAVEEINGRKYVVFEFVSTIRSDEEDIINTRSISKYTYIQYTIVNYKTVLFHFSCPAQASGMWASTAAEIMATVKVSNKF